MFIGIYRSVRIRSGSIPFARVMHSLCLGVRQFLLKNLYWVVPGQLGFRANIPVLAEGMEAVGAPLPLEMTFKKPSLFLAGGNSHYILEEDHLSIKQAFPAAQIETVKNAGHWLHAENPKEFYQQKVSSLPFSSEDFSKSPRI